MSLVIFRCNFTSFLIKDGMYIRFRYIPFVGNVSSRFTINSEVFALDLIVNLEELLGTTCTVMLAICSDLQPHTDVLDVVRELRRKFLCNIVNPLTTNNTIV